jgi:hypothetical protein
MGLHDRIFKELLRCFLADFLGLVAPELAARLRPADAAFLDKEALPNWPKGERREVDLVAEVPVAAEQGEVVWVHVEVEAKARAASARRVWRYAQVLEVHFGGPVLSVLVNLRAGRPGVSWRVIDETVLGEETHRFRYLEFGLGGCPAEEYLARPEPLAWALSALMRRRTLRPAEHKLQCIKRIAGASLTAEERFILGTCVEVYLDLQGDERQKFDALQRLEEHQEVAAMEMTWLERAEAQGEKRGLERGRQEGRHEGRREGEARLLLGQLERKFGAVAPGVRTRVETADAELLLRWGERLLDAERLEEVFES